ncbi:uncharacterized protein N0V89_004421 [Didymosphaeria variabile]|uniref:Uncharacterized protein n=1 Tax=Didymosphaeria variabile TaxID=1932322 RepID=A0A9W8XS53_9PLEO|nr:uncharacterized protein N0V89_004421 [Didymosphaeria variabile]KAJ4356388.1 hypothetical protein N0V89_004421 [Didymosphaeria variabile]
MQFLNHFLILSIAASVRASPVSTDSEASNAMLSRRWEQPDVPADWINKSSEMTGEQLVAEYAPSGARALLSRASGCSQGECPDRDPPFRSDAPWDLEFQFTVIPDPSPVPFPIFTQEYHLRINDCDKCQRIKTGSYNNENGCYNFNSCGRDQTICIDDKNHRAHRIWKDNGHKDCFNLIVDPKGSCGFVKGKLEH